MAKLTLARRQAEASAQPYRLAYLQPLETLGRFAAGLKPSHPRALAPTPIYHRRASDRRTGAACLRPLVSFMSSGSAEGRCLKTAPAEASRPLSQKGVFNGQHHAVRGKISLVHLYAGDYRLLAPDSVALERAKGYLSSDHG